MLLGVLNVLGPVFTAALCMPLGVKRRRGLLAEALDVRLIGILQDGLVYRSTYF